MKKNILIICSLIIVSLSSFAYINWNNKKPVQQEILCKKIAAFEDNYSDSFRPIKPELLYESDLVYKVESRFLTRITKERLNNATSIIDILPKEATKMMETYENVLVSILQKGGEIKEVGINEKLNKAQLKLLQSADYSSNFYINADCKQRTTLGQLYDYHLVYYLTIIPEQEAKFMGGNETLIQYLKDNSKSATEIITKDRLRAGQVSFTVSKDGTITNVKLESSSGFPSVDKVLVDLIENMPPNWQPATNSKGEKVDQDLIFFFGLFGC